MPAHHQEFLPARKCPPTESRYVSILLQRNRACNRQTFRNIVQRYGQGDAKSQLQVAARRDKGGNPFREVMQTDAESEQNGCALDRFWQRLQPIFALILRMRMWQHAVQAKIAKQTEDKHSITQHRRHSFGG